MVFKVTTLYQITDNMLTPCQRILHLITYRATIWWYDNQPFLDRVRVS